MLTIDLKDKVAIVTGATQGIGLGVASMLAKAGCSIAGCGRSDFKSEKAIQFRSVIEKLGQKVFYKQVDVKSEQNIAEFVKDIAEGFGKINFLISNAGKNMFTVPDTCDTMFWDENIDLNLKSHWLLSKYCYPYLKRNNGTILLMSSNHAYATLPNCFPYNVTKAGITGLVNAFTVQWGPEVRTIGLAPGFINTEGGDIWFESFSDPETKRKEVLNIHPVGRLGTVEEVGAFCAFLCSTYSNFIAGTTYLMDGGRSAVLQDI